MGREPGSEDCTALFCGRETGGHIYCDSHNETTPKQGPYATDESLEAAAQSARKGTAEARDLAARSERTALAREAQQGGRGGFAKLLSGIRDVNEALRQYHGAGKGFTGAEKALVEKAAQPGATRIGQAAEKFVPPAWASLGTIPGWMLKLGMGRLPWATVVTAAAGAVPAALSTFGKSGWANRGAGQRNGKSRRSDPRPVRARAQNRSAGLERRTRRHVEAVRQLRKDVTVSKKKEAVRRNMARR
jgi:hypothetical protein